MSGLFITVEGTDGSGKSTQCQMLSESLLKEGFEVISVREPGGNKISEQIRQIIIDIENKEMSDLTEVLLYAASRAQLSKQIIIPALKDGNIVICDRYMDSSIVYQSYARGIDIKTVEKINNLATCGLVPDITFFLKLEPSEGLIRKKNQSSYDRIESEKFYFHKKVYKGYVELSKKYPQRIKTIDASKDINTIHNKIITQINTLLNERSL